MSSVFLIVVVIYETDIDKSQTLRNLFSIKSKVQKFPKILLYDNSVVKKYSEEHSQDIAYYKHDPSNGGVSAAYNYAAELGASINKEWLIIFDQDTDVKDDYFKQLQHSLARFPSTKLFCPTIRANNKIISPAYYFAHRGFSYIKPKAGLVTSRDYTIINSGVAINIKELEALGGFDKELPLDFSDHYFFYRYKKRNEGFAVIDCVIMHNLSSDSDYHFPTVFKRYKKFCASSFIYSRKVGSCFPLVWLFFRTLKLTVKFSRLEFVKLLFFKQ